MSAIMKAYKNNKSIVRTDDGNTEFINISGGVLQGDTLAIFILIFSRHNLLQYSI